MNTLDRSDLRFRFRQSDKEKVESCSKDDGPLNDKTDKPRSKLQNIVGANDDNAKHEGNAGSEEFDADTEPSLGREEVQHG